MAATVGVAGPRADCAGWLCGEGIFSETGVCACAAPGRSPAWPGPRKKSATTAMRASPLRAIQPLAAPGRCKVVIVTVLLIQPQV